MKWKWKSFTYRSWANFWHFHHCQQVIVAAQDWIWLKTIRLCHRDPWVNCDCQENASSSKVYSADYFQQQRCRYGFSLICFVNAHLGPRKHEPVLVSPAVLRGLQCMCPVREALSVSTLTQNWILLKEWLRLPRLASCGTHLNATLSLSRSLAYNPQFFLYSICTTVDIAVHCCTFIPALFPLH